MVHHKTHSSLPGNKERLFSARVNGILQGSGVRGEKATENSQSFNLNVFLSFSLGKKHNNKHKCSSLSSEEEAGGRGEEQEEEKLLTVNISDLRGRLKEMEAPLKARLDARLPAQGRALWLPGPARAHTHTRAFTAPPARPVCPQQQTGLSVSVPESSLHRINCNNWQVGHWLLGFNSAGAHGKKKKKNWMFCCSQYLAWALRSFSFP